MPFVEIYSNCCLPGEGRAALLSRVRSCVSESFASPENTVTVFLHETGPENTLYAGDDSRGLMSVIVHCFAGRTREQKRSLYAGLHHLAEELCPGPVLCQVTVEESPRENWGIRKGLCAADVLGEH